MKINIYYGGRGIVDDPTLCVLNKMQEVLDELNVTVERYNLYEYKNSITTLPSTLNNVDGVILAITVEWYGIGGYMQQFLDSCWLYGNKEKISKLYMCPVAMSTTYGEREGKMHLTNAWEILGGLPSSGLCGYVSDLVAFELNKDYRALIEKKTENLYRTISQKYPCMPASNQAVKQMISTTKAINLTPQETEQLSKYASDDIYVQKQKEDIQELSNYFKGMIEKTETENGLDLENIFQHHFKGEGNLTASYKFLIKEKEVPFILEIKGNRLVCYYGNLENPTVICKLTFEVMTNIIESKISFQRAFMSGEMQVRGDFQILRMLDQVFDFMKV